MQRFYLPNVRPVLNQPVDLTPLARQLSRVLRLGPGAQIALFNGDGYDYAVAIDTLTNIGATGTVIARRPTPTELSFNLTLYQCSLKADKFEWVLQKGTELGVTGFVPVISARSIVRPAAALLKKYDRWQAILCEAAEQSGRAAVPHLADPLLLAEALRTADGLRLLPYEALANDASMPRLRDLDHHAFGADVSLLVGPEGGFDHAEVQAARAADWQTVSLGPRILRAETAALAAIAILTQ